MRRFRFHLGTLVILVLLLGVGFAALRESTDLWDTGIFSVTLGVLLISILLAIHRADKRRAFWLGFALFGSAYLGLSLVPSVESRLITNKVLAYLASKMPRSSPYDIDGWMDLYVANTAAAGLNTAWFSNTLVGPTLSASRGTSDHFVRIGHSLLTLIAALLGGQLSRYLYGKSRDPDLRSVKPLA